MTNYLLLRNNKESGPYSINDLVQLGLKAYDLVWVQGKSAAWRYPSEIDELKPYAPSVEEQPFDRFYKKNGEVKEEIKQVKEETPIIKEDTTRQETSFISPEHEKYVPKKSVFVTMPGGQKIATTQPVKKEVPVVKEEPKPVPVSAQPTITVSENPNTAQIKYSQPLDDIKEMYVKTLQDRKQKIARKSFWMQSLKNVAVIFGLIAIGAIAALLFKSNGNKKDLVAQKQETTKSQPQTIKQESASVLSENNEEKANSTPSNEEVQTLPPPTGGFVNKKVAPPQHNVANDIDLKKSLDKPANNTAAKEIITSSRENDFANGLVAQQGVDIDQSTGERSRKVRSAGDTEHKTNEIKKNEERSFVPSELEGLISVTSNNYKKVAFGGIRDLQLTVTNDSKYVLDNVIVELQYIKPNELPLRTENIRFTSVGPKSTSTVRIPDTNRGIRVEYHIISVKSKKMEEGVAGN